MLVLLMVDTRVSGEAPAERMLGSQSGMKGGPNTCQRDRYLSGPEKRSAKE
jgi:hypothetical protein